MTRRIALLTTLLALAVTAPAAAQSNPFGPLPAAEATPTATMATTTTTVDDGDTDRNVLIIVGGALILGFAVMGWYIMRDARAAAPKEATGPRLREEGPHKHGKQAKSRARARTRAQKQARKAHRKR